MKSKTQQAMLAGRDTQRNLPLHWGEGQSEGSPHKWAFQKQERVWEFYVHKWGTFLKIMSKRIDKRFEWTLHQRWHSGGKHAREKTLNIISHWGIQAKVTMPITTCFQNGVEERRKKLETPSADKDELLYFIGRNSQWHSHFGKVH